MFKRHCFILLLLLCFLFCTVCSNAENVSEESNNSSVPSVPTAPTPPASDDLPTETDAEISEEPYVPASALSVSLHVAERAAFVSLPEPAYVPDAVASGTAEERCETAVIDYSHTEDGYIMIQYEEPCEQRLKVLIEGPTATYSYNLTPETWTVFPLSDGSGTYRAGIYINVADVRYAVVCTVTFTVELTDEFAPFLRPNQYVDYSEASEVVSVGLDLTRGLTDPLDKVAAVYDYVVSNLEYDYDKAATVKSGYLPVLDQVLADKKGICFDYAAMMAAMLRSQQIPCKLVVGFAGDVYHSWISVWTEENGWVDGVIFFDGSTWKRMDPTFASSSHRSDEIMDFSEHGSYTTKYLY